jgi:hypothetical protein
MIAAMQDAKKIVNATKMVDSFGDLNMVQTKIAIELFRRRGAAWSGPEPEQ